MVPPFVLLLQNKTKKRSEKRRHGSGKTRLKRGSPPRTKAERKCQSKTKTSGTRKCRRCEKKGKRPRSNERRVENGADSPTTRMNTSAVSLLGESLVEVGPVAARVRSKTPGFWSGSIRCRRFLFFASVVRSCRVRPRVAGSSQFFMFFFGFCRSYETRCFCTVHRAYLISFTAVQFGT